MKSNEVSESRSPGAELLFGNSHGIFTTRVSYTAIKACSGSAMDSFPEGGVLREMSSRPVPFVMVNRVGLIVFVNQKFTKILGWSQDDVLGKTLDCVLPEAFRLSHHLAFSTFDDPASSKVIGHPLMLKTLMKDGNEIITEHHIIAERESEDWFFGATLTPSKNGESG